MALIWDTEKEVVDTKGVPKLKGISILTGYETKSNNGETLIVRNGEIIARFYGDGLYCTGELAARICVDALNKADLEIEKVFKSVAGGSGVVIMRKEY